jgi:hypothetical protein
MDNQRVLCEFVEVGYALDEDVACGRNTCELAVAQRLEGREKRVGVLADRKDLGKCLADDRVRFVGGVLSEELGEFGVGGKGWLDGNDNVGGEVGNTGDYGYMSVFLFTIS